MLVPGAFALTGLLILLGLGTWQIERKAWKEALIETLTRRLAEAPVALPPPGEWMRMTQDDAEFLRVRLRIEPTTADDALVYAGGSALRDDVKTPGYFVFAPTRLPGGKTLVVNRGFSPARNYPRIVGPQEIVGVLRWPEAPLWFVAAHDPAGAVWHLREHRAMAAFKGWGEVAPFYVEQESPVPPGGLPHPSPLKVRLRNDHLQYAITWYALAGVLAFMFALWALKTRRRPAGHDAATA
jgi:cytochrome oxidase assembly protein ShyY1